MMKMLRYILFPFVPVYFLVTWFRNKLYDFGMKSSKAYNLPVICVGNLSFGGTGKTPMIEYLIKLLKNDYKLATLSRGYKRKTKGFQLANKISSAETIGDEPFQFYNKFGKDILVAVDSDRKNGISNLQKESPELVLLDDAYQHRKVKAGLNILLTTYANPFYNDFVLPTGNLREPRYGMKRAHIIVVTKCPEYLSGNDKSQIIKSINPKENQKVFFSSIKYSEEVVSENKTLKLKELSSFTLVTGIANPKPLVNFLSEKDLKFQHLNFNDHHEFSKQEVTVLTTKELIVTTEKDFMRLKQYESLKEKLFYLPIEVTIGDHLKFDSLIRGFVTN